MLAFTFPQTRKRLPHRGRSNVLSHDSAATMRNPRDHPPIFSLCSEKGQAHRARARERSDRGPPGEVAPHGTGAPEPNATAGQKPATRGKKGSAAGARGRRPPAPRRSPATVGRFGLATARGYRWTRAPEPAPSPPERPGGEARAGGAGSGSPNAETPPRGRQERLQQPDAPPAQTRA